MKQNVLLIGLLHEYNEQANRIQRLIPDLVITSNFEQVLGMAKTEELEQLCVIIGGFNYSKCPSNTIDGYKVAEEIHQIDPSIPMLIINGSKTEISKETGLLENVSQNTPTETYVENEDTIRTKFFTGELFLEFFKKESV